MVVEELGYRVGGRQGEGAGRFLLAAKTFRPGETVLAEIPLIQVIFMSWDCTRMFLPIFSLRKKVKWLATNQVCSSTQFSIQNCFSEIKQLFLQHWKLEGRAQKHPVRWVVRFTRLYSLPGAQGASRCLASLCRVLSALFFRWKAALSLFFGRLRMRAIWEWC